MTITINSIDRTNFLLEKPVMPQRKTFSVADLIATDIELKFDNTTNIFSKYNSNSIFYGQEWYNQTINIIDDDGGIWYGLIHKNRRTSDKIATITAVTVMVLASDINCTAQISSATPAQAILSILSKYYLYTAIDSQSFADASSFQSSFNFLISLNYQISDNVKDLAVIQEIGTLAFCDIYSINNKIYCHQRKPYKSQGAIWLNPKLLIAESQVMDTDERNIFNSYDIKGINGEGLNSNSVAKSKFGNYDIPRKKDYSSGNQITILSTSIQISQYYDQFLNIYAYLADFAEFETTPEFSANMSDYILYTDEKEGIINQPFEIFNKTPNPSGKKIQWIAYALNLAGQTIDISEKITPPADIQNFCLLITSTTVTGNWNPPINNPSKYLIYYGLDIDLTGNFFANGLSPITIAGNVNSFSFPIFLLNKYSKSFIFFGIVGIGQNGMRSNMIIQKIQLPIITISNLWDSGFWDYSLWSA